MKHLKLILFLCLLNQGCSTNSNLPMNQPRSHIQTSMPTTIEEPNVGALGSQQVEPSDIIYDDGKKLEEPKEESKKELTKKQKQENAEGVIRNMSDTSDFMPEQKSYWM